MSSERCRSLAWSLTEVSPGFLFGWVGGHSGIFLLGENTIKFIQILQQL